MTILNSYNIERRERREKEILYTDDSWRMEGRGFISHNTLFRCTVTSEDTFPDSDP